MKPCKTCGTPLIQRPTKHKVSQGKSYYYTAYYWCPNCKKMYLDDKFKVENTKSSSMFDLESLVRQPVDIEIWTDGACSHNGMPSAKAAWAFVSGNYEKNGLVEGKQTNNTAEGLAIYNALLWAVEKGAKIIKIHTDSQISINNLKKHPSKVKENREIFERIFDLIEKNNLTVIYQKVAGHAGDVNNERADRLANGLVGIQ